jgi:hypothetical protein
MYQTVIPFVKPLPPLKAILLRVKLTEEAGRRCREDGTGDFARHYIALLEDQIDRLMMEAK